MMQHRSIYIFLFPIKLNNKIITQFIKHNAKSIHIFIYKSTSAYLIYYVKLLNKTSFNFVFVFFLNHSMMIDDNRM